MWQIHCTKMSSISTHSYCRYVVLAKADSDQITLLNLTAADKKLADLATYKNLLQTFSTQEVSTKPSYMPRGKNMDQAERAEL